MFALFSIGIDQKTRLTVVWEQVNFSNGDFLFPKGITTRTVTVTKPDNP